MDLDPHLGDEPSTWQERLDLVVFVGITAAMGAWILGFVSTPTLIELLLAALGLSCVAFGIAVLRGDDDRPLLILPLAALMLVAVEWVVFRGAGPEWLQALLGLGYLLFAFSRALPSGDRVSLKPVERDRPPPY